jgi:threonine aldolase
MTDSLKSDFRSDTVTRPTTAMRQAMLSAEVGDDVFGDDPTVGVLEAEAARLFEKEAAVFLPSGTMANLIALMLHCRPGEEAIVEETSHVFRNEQGSAARFGGIQLRGVAGDARGSFDPQTLPGFFYGGENASMGERLHCPRTALVVIENTHNFKGGRVQRLSVVEEVAKVARAHGVRVHIDGARLMNAVAASGVTAARWAACADTVMLCLSKGLCAPVGSLLIGDQQTIFDARRARKALGGGMRQVGVLAAPARIALRQMAERLEEDHRHAKALAKGLAGIPGVEVDPDSVETNMVFLKLPGGAEAHGALANALTARGVGCCAVGALGVRFVTHNDVGADDVERAIEEVAAVLAEEVLLA